MLRRFLYLSLIFFAAILAALFDMDDDVLHFLIPFSLDSVSVTLFRFHFIFLYLSLIFLAAIIAFLFVRFSKIMLSL